MKRWAILLAVLSIGLLGQNRPDNFNFTRTDRGNVVFSISGKNVQHESGSVVVLTNATMDTKVISISADEMKFDPETGEAELRGNVHVKISR